jgi:hypothetical protein
LQNREELRQNGHQQEEKCHFQKGGWINIVFKPKYRPLDIRGNKYEKEKRKGGQFKRKRKKGEVSALKKAE